MSPNKRVARARISRKRQGSKAPPPAAKKQWRASPPELVQLFDRIRDGLPPPAERRKMFGYPCSFVNGQMFAGLHQENMVLRLSEADRRQFLRLEGAGLFEPMPGRVMKEYVVVPASLLHHSTELMKWIEKSFAFALSLGPKPMKKRTSSKL